MIRLNATSTMINCEFRYISSPTGITNLPTFLLNLTNSNFIRFSNTILTIDYSALKTDGANLLTIPLGSPFTSTPTVIFDNCFMNITNGTSLNYILQNKSGKNINLQFHRPSTITNTNSGAIDYTNVIVNQTSSIITSNTNFLGSTSINGSSIIGGNLDMSLNAINRVSRITNTGNIIIDPSNTLFVDGILDLSRNIMRDVSGIYFSDGTYVGHGASFDISTNQLMNISSSQNIIIDPSETLSILGNINMNQKNIINVYQLDCSINSSQIRSLFRYDFFQIVDSVTNDYFSLNNNTLQVDNSSNSSYIVMNPYDGLKIQNAKKSGVPTNTNTFTHSNIIIDNSPGGGPTNTITSGDMLIHNNNFINQSIITSDNLNISISLTDYYVDVQPSSTVSFNLGVGQTNLQTNINQLFVVNQNIDQEFQEQPKIRLGTDVREPEITNYKNNNILYFENKDIFLNGRWFEKPQDEKLNHGQYFKFNNCGYGYNPVYLPNRDDTQIYRYYNFIILNNNNPPDNRVNLLNLEYYLDTSSDTDGNGNNRIFNKVGWSCRIINISEIDWNISSSDASFFVSTDGDSGSTIFTLKRYKSIEITLIWSNDKYYWFIHQFA